MIEMFVNNAVFVGPGADAYNITGLLASGPTAWRIVSEGLEWRFSAAVTLCMQAQGGNKPLYLGLCSCGMAFPSAGPEGRVQCMRCERGIKQS